MHSIDGPYRIARWLLLATVGDPQDPVAFVVDLRSGHDLALEPDPSRAICAIAATGFPPAGTETAVRELRDAGWIAPAAQQPPDSPERDAGAVSTPHAEWAVKPGDVTRGDRVCALVGVLFACSAFLVPGPYRMRYVLATAHLAAIGARSPAPILQLQRLIAAVDAVSAWWPWRFACLERAHATVIAARVRGRRADLRIGAALAPPRRHTWVETQGIPVTRRGDPRIMGVFVPMRQARRSGRRRAITRPEGRR